MPQLHFDSFLHLAGLTHDDALIAWGGFWFEDTDLRFTDGAEVGRASVAPGRYYRFQFGADIEFVAIDTTLASELEHRFSSTTRSIGASSRTSSPTRPTTRPGRGGSPSPTIPRSVPAPSTTTGRTSWNASRRCSSAPGRV